MKSNIVVKSIFLLFGLFFLAACNNSTMDGTYTSDYFGGFIDKNYDYEGQVLDADLEINKTEATLNYKAVYENKTKTDVTKGKLNVDKKIIEFKGNGYSEKVTYTEDKNALELTDERGNTVTVKKTN